MVNKKLFELLYQRQSSFAGLFSIKSFNSKDINCYSFYWQLNNLLQMMQLFPS